VQFLLVEVDVEMLLERVAEGGHTVVQRNRLHSEHRIVEHVKQAGGRRDRQGLGGQFARLEAVGGQEAN
jgi:hypothetical protein